MVHMSAILVLTNPGYLVIWSPLTKHPDVVTSNLCKEISLRRVVGPFISSPLSNLQCHHLGVVPKKHSSEWHTINDHIPKDPYALQYVRVDDAIRILKSVGPGSFMAISLSSYPDPPRWLASPRYLLGKPILRRHVPPFRALFSPLRI